MKQLKLLEQELKMIQENIERVKEYKKYKEETEKYKPYNCHVFGELNHRLVALKQRITLVNKETTWSLFH